MQTNEILKYNIKKINKVVLISNIQPVALHNLESRQMKLHKITSKPLDT